MMRYLYLSSLLAILMTMIAIYFKGNAIENKIMTLRSPVWQCIPPPPPPPSPPPPERIEYRTMPADFVYTVADQVPRFPGCEDAFGSDEQKSECAENKLLEFVYKNLKYPESAKKNGVQGRVIIQFIVEKDGSISNIHCIRDIGDGCGFEAVRVVNSMSQMSEKWTPGKIKGDAVRVKYILPVSFKIGGMVIGNR